MRINHNSQAAVVNSKSKKKGGNVMRTMKCTLISIMIIGLVLQGLIGQVFAADTGDEIAKFNAVSGSGELLNQTAGEALPSPIIPLNSDEEAVLLSLENSNQALLGQKATGSRTECYTETTYPYRRICNTTDTTDSPSREPSGPPTCSKAEIIISGVKGCLLGGLIGSLGDPVGASMAVGCAVGVVLFSGLTALAACD